MNVSVLAAVLLGLAGLAFFWFVTRSGTVRTTVGLSRPRTLYLLVGLVNSGKTTMLTRLLGHKGPGPLETVTSTKANRAVVAGVSLPVVDYPGHRRLRPGVFSVLEETKKLVIVVDSETIQDDRDEGAQALSELMADLFQSRAFNGVSGVLIACTKQDSPTSYRALAVRRFLEKELTLLLSTRSGTVGSISAIQNVKTQESRASKTSKVDDACALFLSEDGKFSFDSLPVPVKFVEVSSVENDTNHSLQPLLDFFAE
jgi:signal recognition particle receptor subunit beta